MKVEHWWNDADRGKPKCSAKNLCRCHFVHHITDLGPKPGLGVEGPPTTSLDHGKDKSSVPIYVMYEHLVRIAHMKHCVSVSLKGNVVQENKCC